MYQVHFLSRWDGVSCAEDVPGALSHL